MYITIAVKRSCEKKRDLSSEIFTQQCDFIKKEND